MNKFIVMALFWSLLVIILYLFADSLYEKGYADREEIFQNNPVIFSEGVENVAKVYRENNGFKIKIYNDKLVEIIK